MRYLMIFPVILFGCGADPTFMGICPAPGGYFYYPEGTDVASDLCSEPQEVTWPRMPLTIVNRLDPDDRDSLTAAIEFWNDELGILTFVLGVDLGEVEVVHGGTGGRLGSTRHLLADGILGATVEVDVYDPCEVYRVLAHELGHVLGLAHDTVSGSIMVARFTTNCYETTYVVTEEDCTALRMKY